jgi:hypothetical protein
MPDLHERLLSHVCRERDRLLSRRRLLGGGAVLAASALVARTSEESLLVVLAQDASPFADDLEVLNFALAVEHMAHAFFRDGRGQFALGVDGYGNDIASRLNSIRKHEAVHIEMLTQVVAGLGGTPASEMPYDFGYTDAGSFLATAAAITSTGLMAYDCAGRFLGDRGLITAAASIAAVEARHSAYLNLVIGASPAPMALEPTRDPDEIRDLVGQYLAP